jgi:hypothetical protein
MTAQQSHGGADNDVRVEVTVQATSWFAASVLYVRCSTAGRSRQLGGYLLPSGIPRPPLAASRCRAAR